MYPLRRTGLINQNKIVSGWPFANVLTVSQTDPDADHSTIAAAITAASAGDIIKIDPGTYNESLNVSKAIVLDGFDANKTEITTGGSAITIGVTTSDVVLKNLKVGNTNAGSSDRCVEIFASSNNCVIENCILEISTAGTANKGIQNVGGTGLIVQETDITISGGTASNRCYDANTAANDAEIFGGKFDASGTGAAEIVLNHASAVVGLYDPILENAVLTLTLGNALGTYYDGSGELIFRNGLNVIDGEKILLGDGNDGAIYSSSDDLYIENDTSNKDIIMKINDGGADTELIRLDGDVSRVGILEPSPSAPLDVQGWTRIPGNISGISLNVGGDFFAGTTSEVADIARLRFSSNSVLGFWAFNSYFSTIPGLRAIDTSSPAWLMQFDVSGDTMDIRRAPATAGAQAFVDLLVLQADGDLVPGSNKAQDLGQTSTRWNILYAGTSTSVGTSRIFDSTRMCPVCDPPERMKRGTGSLCILGEDRDYEVAMCPSCGVLATEEMRHLPTVKLADRLPAPKIEFLGFHIFAMSGNSRKVRADYKYQDEVVDTEGNITTSAILNSTYLGELEISDFQLMTEIDRQAFLRDLGQREWDAMEEARLIEEEVSELQFQLDNLVVNLIGTDLK